MARPLLIPSSNEIGSPHSTGKEQEIMRNLWAMPLLLVLVCFVTQASAQDQPTDKSPANITPVTIVLNSGRTFTGMVDRRTNSEHLWLRSGSERANITRPIAWSVIASIHQNETSLTPEQVQHLAAQDDGRQAPVALPQRLVEPGRIIIIRPLTAADHKPSKPQISAANSSRPTTLHLDARVDNFDADPENDGLVVELRLLNQRGQLVPYQGTAHVVWYGPQVRNGSSVSSARSVILGDWTSAVMAEAGHSPPLLQLPFQRVNPEEDNSLWNYSLVTVALNIPGVGNFSAELDGLRVRRWEPYRDFLQSNPVGPLVTKSGRRP